MQPSKECLDLIKSEEGCILHAYHGRADRPGLLTIGYGIIQYPDGSPVKLGDIITQVKADDLLYNEVNKKASVIDAALTHAGVTLKQNQFDSLVDFAYNEGVEGLIFKSTLFKKVLANPNDPTISSYVKSKGRAAINSCEFLKWVYANGVVVEDLIERRMRDADLYAGRAYALKS